MENVQVSLVVFFGEQGSIVGIICLPVYAEGINQMVKFMVVNCPLAYNAILGRSWIHELKAVPSTYH